MKLAQHRQHDQDPRVEKCGKEGKPRQGKGARAIAGRPDHLGHMNLACCSDRFIDARRCSSKTSAVCAVSGYGASAVFMLYAEIPGSVKESWASER